MTNRRRYHVVLHRPAPPPAMPGRVHRLAAVLIGLPLLWAFTSFFMLMGD